MGIIKLNKMIGKISALCALTATVCAAPSDHWAIIVAGSSGFGNYRHQADTCHAYQIVKDSGIPEEQIIMFNYDDAANSSYQHADFKGKLFNKPTAAGVQGVDVYEGCNIDFKGKHATAKNLLSVMKGDPLEDSTASKKTLKSNSNSKIFFYFADHGAPGLVAIPVGKYLYADELFATVKQMYANDMYKEMVMYMEACEGGSMFEKFDYKSLNVYATSATNGKVSSWGTYCSPHDKVDGKSVGSCLGDLYSVTWMEDTDKHSKTFHETLKTQYETVKKETTKSPVQEFGNLDIQKEPIGAFQSTQSGAVAEDKKFWRLIKSGAKSLVKDIFDIDEKMAYVKNESAVNSRDINLHYLYSQVMLNDTHENACGKFDDYSMKYMSVLAAECEGIKSVPENMPKSIVKIQESCSL